MGEVTAIYMRVSSKTQDLASQRPDLERYAKTIHDGPVRWFEDHFTGKTMKRPGWDLVDVLLKGGCLKRVVVWRTDRLGRTASGLTALYDELTARAVGLVSIKDKLDLDSPAGRLMAVVMAGAGQYETEVRSERQVAGIAAAQARGVKFGRPNPKGVPLKVTEAKRTLILKLKADGLKVAWIARTVELSRDTVHQVISRG